MIADVRHAPRPHGTNLQPKSFKAHSVLVCSLDGARRSEPQQQGRLHFLHGVYALRSDVEPRSSIVASREVNTERNTIVGSLVGRVGGVTGGVERHKRRKVVALHTHIHAIHVWSGVVVRTQAHLCEEGGLRDK
jgi:hypothetical protein